jgi:hypothetical protein
MLAAPGLDLSAFATWFEAWDTMAFDYDTRLARPEIY